MILALERPMRTFELFEEGVLYFPPEEIMFHDIEAKSRDSTYERIKICTK